MFFRSECSTSFKTRSPNKTEAHRRKNNRVCRGAVKEKKTHKIVSTRFFALYEIECFFFFPLRLREFTLDMNSSVFFFIEFLWEIKLENECVCLLFASSLLRAFSHSIGHDDRSDFDFVCGITCRYEKLI
jgi:hypothetical protein